MEKKIFSKDELKQIRDVAALLTRKQMDVPVADLSLIDGAYYLWKVFLKFDGDSIYE